MGGVRDGVEAVSGAKEDAPGAQASRSGFDAFFRANYAWAVNIAHLLTGDRWAAEDLAQDSFSRMHWRFEDLANPQAFLRVCVVNASHSWHRGRARDERRMRAASVPGPAAFEARELLDALDRLPYRQKAVLVLRYYADLSEGEIAEALDCRSGTVKSLAARALGRLRKEIEP